ncbi:MAG TPA: hypothetical protein VKR52_06605 [Terracidiphilus sp.]|nr:hypothetical protein [Terracidiphilus sp.]
MSKRSAVLIALLTLATMPAIVSAQVSGNAAAKNPASQSAQKQGQDPAPSQAGDGTTAANAPPQIIVNPPPPVVPPWTWRERIAWGANIVLAVLGYVGIMLFLRMLKNIERNTESSAATAQAAVDTAQAALEQTQLLLEAERPWIVVRVDPSLTKENSFRIMATNRGRTPARIVSLVDRVEISVDETSLPATPEYEGAKTAARPEPIVLLPSESVPIKTFSRDDARAVCKAPEEFEKIELWEKNIFLHGRVTYRDMTSSTESEPFLTDWCYWYIHGDKKSALTIAGTPEYNKHS